MVADLSGRAADLRPADLVRAGPLQDLHGQLEFLSRCAHDERGAADDDLGGVRNGGLRLAGATLLFGALGAGRLLGALGALLFGGLLCGLLRRALIRGCGLPRRCPLPAALCERCLRRCRDGHDLRLRGAPVADGQLEDEGGPLGDGGNERAGDGRRRAGDPYCRCVAVTHARRDVVRSCDAALLPLVVERDTVADALGAREDDRAQVLRSFGRGERRRRGLGDDADGLADGQPQVGDAVLVMPAADGRASGAPEERLGLRRLARGAHRLDADVRDRRLGATRQGGAEGAGGVAGAAGAGPQGALDAVDDDAGGQRHRDLDVLGGPALGLQVDDAELDVAEAANVRDALDVRGHAEGAIRWNHLQRHGDGLVALFVLHRGRDRAEVRPLADFARYDGDGDGADLLPGGDVGTGGDRADQWLHGAGTTVRGLGVHERDAAADRLRDADLVASGDDIAAAVGNLHAIGDGLTGHHLRDGTVAPRAPAATGAGELQRRRRLGVADVLDGDRHGAGDRSSIGGSTRRDAQPTVPDMRIVRGADGDVQDGALAGWDLQAGCDAVGAPGASGARPGGVFGRQRGVRWQGDPDADVTCRRLADIADAQADRLRTTLADVETLAGEDVHVKPGGSEVAQAPAVRVHLAALAAVALGLAADLLGGRPRGLGREVPLVEDAAFLLRAASQRVPRHGQRFARLAQLEAVPRAALRGLR